MREEFEKKIKSKRNILKGIGIFEIVGGVTGLGLIFWLMLQGTETNTFVLLILLFAIAFYIYSIFAGVKLFKHQENDVRHSQIFQCIQILGISFGGFTYLMTSGGYLFLGYNFTEGNITFSFALVASKFQINLLNSSQGSFIYLNFLAILVLVILEKSLIIIQEQKKLKESYDQNMAEFLSKSSGTDLNRDQEETTNTV
ncbi:hypothetical protein [Flagellimonas sp. 2504JD1-5]